LEEINNFAQETTIEENPENSLISSIFSQINPFSQYVIQDLHKESQEDKGEEAAEPEEVP